MPIKISEAHKRSNKLAVKAVVHIASGTDVGLSSVTNRHNRCMNGSEYRHAINARARPCFRQETLGLPTGMRP